VIAEGSVLLNCACDGCTTIQALSLSANEEIFVAAFASTVTCTETRNTAIAKTHRNQIRQHIVVVMKWKLLASSPLGLTERWLRQTSLGRHRSHSRTAKPDEPLEIASKAWRKQHSALPWLI